MPTCFFARLVGGDSSDYVNSRKKKSANTGDDNLGIIPNCNQEGSVVNWPCVEASTWCLSLTYTVWTRYAAFCGALIRRRCFLLSGMMIISEILEMSTISCVRFCLKNTTYGFEPYCLKDIVLCQLFYSITKHVKGTTTPWTVLDTWSRWTSTTIKCASACCR